MRQSESKRNKFFSLQTESSKYDVKKNGFVIETSKTRKINNYTAFILNGSDKSMPKS